MTSYAKGLNLIDTPEGTTEEQVRLNLEALGFSDM